MSCAFCGEGDRWIKTCRTEDGLVCVCDPCWEALSPWLIIVPGRWVVTARCDGCGAYFNPRKMAEYSPGGRYNAYSGTCGSCAEVVGTGEAVVVTTRGIHGGEEGGCAKTRGVTPAATGQ